MHEDTEVTIGGETFPADSPLVPLLQELNKVGLRTCYHCQGKPHSDAYISFDLDAVTEIKVVQNKHGRRLIIQFPRIK